ncbi:TetR/AcrR family transcriptional regulator [Balneatrix alpica]|uniref:TetR/AcrR family transcriptional regulator n=1 Tax=Balneatrix alpica TaxID=75684 RepID=UPI002739065F|nr:TetR/AcrR family transcriptional regulator [Balneatrix alpica]
MRTPEFDREQVLRQAMEAFRAKGYAATTMQDLVQATGLHPGSIYCAFQNKRGLLEAAVDYYIQLRGEALEQLLSQTSPLAGIAAFLQDVIAESQSCNSASCLLNKTLSELASQDEAMRERLCHFLKAYEQRLCQAVKAAQAAGEIDRTAAAEDLTRFLVVGVHGLRTYAYTHPSRAALEDVVQRLLRGLQG